MGARSNTSSSSTGKLNRDVQTIEQWFVQQTGCPPFHVQQFVEQTSLPPFRVQHVVAEKGRLFGRVEASVVLASAAHEEVTPAHLKKRVDVLLVERGLAESRTQAQALVMAGLVPGFDKPGTQVDESAELTVKGKQPYVSRGGEKLANGLDALGVDPAGLDCLDLGSSTGGFTDALLQRGAARVIAIDVGTHQLHEKLRADDRVIVMEQTNAREVTELPFAPQLVVCDVSFISVRIALPPVLQLAAPGWQAVVLVKPQFEAGRADVGKGGVVREPETRARVLREVAAASLGWGSRVVGVVDSGLPGPKGNREFFLHLVQSDHPTLPDDLDERIAAAVAAG